MLKDKLDELKDEYPVGTPWRHVESGNLYVISDFVYIENGVVPAVCYFQPSIEDQVVWVRPASEFFDGRFEWVYGLGS